MVGIQNKVIRVGVGDMRVSDDPESIIVTFSLGSCLGIVVYDPVVRIGGLLHAMLPEANSDMSGSGFKPFKYIDTGVPLLFKEAYKYGAQKHRMKIAVAGGSQILDDSGFFNIGQRNIAALKKIFWKNGVMVDKEHIGGSVSRTVRFTLSTGEIMLRLGGGEEIIL